MKSRNGIINNEDVIREIVINTIKDLKKKNNINFMKMSLMTS